MSDSEEAERIGRLVEEAIERDYEETLYDEEFEFKKERHELSLWQEWLSPDRFKYASHKRLSDLWKGLCEAHLEASGLCQSYQLSIDEDPGQIQFQVSLLHLEDWFNEIARGALKKAWSECRKAGVPFDTPHGAGFVRGKVKDLLQKAREKLDADSFCFVFSLEQIAGELVLACLDQWERDIENEIQKLENKAKGDPPRESMRRLVPGETTAPEILAGGGRSPKETVPTIPKRSIKPGDARRKLIPALTLHHNYADGGCLNLDPISISRLARLAAVAKSSASRFFKAEFTRWAHYHYLCLKNSRGLARKIGELNGDHAPRLLYGTTPPETVADQGPDEGTHHGDE